jgi:hypothetical protein
MMKRVFIALTTIALCLPIQDIHSQDLQEIMGKVTNPNKKAVVAPEYKFDAYLRMEMTVEGEQVVYDSYLNKGGGNLAMKFTQKGVPTIVIVDTENNSMILLMESEGQKMGIAMAVNPEAIEELAAGLEKDKPLNELKTGKTKTILGYSCDEYLIKDASSEIRVWTSEKLGKEVGQETLKNQQVFGGTFSRALFSSGMVMEYSYSGGGKKMVLKVTDLDLNRSHTISTGGYQVISPGEGM